MCYWDKCSVRAEGGTAIAKKAFVRDHLIVLLQQRNLECTTAELLARGVEVIFSIHPFVGTVQSASICRYIITAVYYLL